MTKYYHTCIHIASQGRNQTHHDSTSWQGTTWAYNGPIYLYRLSILSGRAQQTFSRAYALLGPPVDTPL